MILDVKMNRSDAEREIRRIRDKLSVLLQTHAQLAYHA